MQLIYRELHASRTIASITNIRNIERNVCNPQLYQVKVGTD